jgi:hypothetical protein
MFVPSLSSQNDHFYVKKRTKSTVSAYLEPGRLRTKRCYFLRGALVHALREPHREGRAHGAAGEEKRLQVEEPRVVGLQRCQHGVDVPQLGVRRPVADETRGVRLDLRDQPLAAVPV